jgi:hypothetical protein
MLYYFSPGDLVQRVMFRDEGFGRITVKPTVAVFGLLRRLPDVPDCLFVERYRYKAVEKVVIQPEDGRPGEDETMSGEEGEPECVLRGIPAVDYTEGFGYTVNGLTEFHASLEEAGSVYRHPVKSEWIFNCSTVGVTLGMDHFAMGVHVDRKRGPYYVVRISINHVAQPVLTVTHGTVRPWLVQDGYIPSLAAELSINVSHCNPENEASLRGVHVRAWTILARQMGPAFSQIQHSLSQSPDVMVQTILHRAVNETVNRALRSVRGQVPKELPQGGFEETAMFHAACRVSAQLQCSPELAESYVRVTKPTTHGGAIVAVAGELLRLVRHGYRLCGRFLDWLHDLVAAWGFSSCYSILGSGTTLLKRVVVALPFAHSLMSVVKSGFRWEQETRRCQKWLARHPAAVRVLDEVLLLVACLVEAAGEEVLKRYGHSTWSLLFGAVEFALDWCSSSAVFPSSFPIKDSRVASLIAAFAYQSVGHLVLRLLPVLPAIALHGFYNFVIRRVRYRGWLQDVARVVDMWAEDWDTLVEMTQVSQPETLRDRGVLKLQHIGEELDIQDMGVEFLEGEMIPPSKKWPMIACDPHLKLLLRPVSTTAQTLQMLKLRFLARPKYDCREEEMAYALHLLLRQWIRPLMADRDRLRLMSWEELLRSIDGKPWNKSKKDEYRRQVKMHQEGESLRGGKRIFVKTDELLVAKPELSLNHPAAKARPVVPANVRSLPSMRYVSRARDFFAEKTYYYVPDVAGMALIDEPCLGEVVVSITYVARPNAQNLSELLTRLSAVQGLHIVMHGDDVMYLRVDESGVVTAGAADIVKCDVSCGEPFQDAFAVSMTEIFEEDSGIEEILADAKSQLEGDFMVTCQGQVFVFHKARISTNTGEMATALKAFFIQMLYTIPAVKSLVVGGQFQFERFREVLTDKARGLGIELEFEDEDHGRGSGCFYPLGATSFLGGRPFWSTEGEVGVVWNSDKFLKLCVLPDVKTIYKSGFRRALKMHMLVLQMDPEMGSNPLLRLYSRYLNQTSHDLGGLEPGDREIAFDRWTKYMMLKDPYKLEMLLDDFVPPRLEEGDFLVGIENHASRMGLRAGCATRMYLRTMEMLHRSAGVWPIQPVEGGMELAFALRFNKYQSMELTHPTIPVPAFVFGEDGPTAAASDPTLLGLLSEDDTLPTLSFVSRVCDLAWKIYNHSPLTSEQSEVQLEWMKNTKAETKTKAKTAAAKEVKKDVAREVKKDARKEVRHELQGKGGAAKGAGVAQHAAAHAAIKTQATFSDGGCLCTAHAYADHLSESEAPPPILGVGTAQSPPRLYEDDPVVELVANAQGFCCLALMPSGWSPDPLSEVSEPSQVTIGGPTGTGPRRGAYAAYTDASWVGLSGGTGPFPLGVIPEGTELLDFGGTPGAQPPGVRIVRLPPAFIPNQTFVDSGSIQASNDRQTFTMTHLSARLEPVGYEVGSAVAVNVVSGDVMGYTMTQGDNNGFAPSAVVDTGFASDSFEWMTSLPRENNIAKVQIVGVTEWKKDTEMCVFTVPNSSVALGAWPPVIQTVNDAGDVDAVLTSTLTGERAGFIVRGAQPFQKFRVRIKVCVAAYGIETYEAGAMQRHRKPVDGTQLSDTLARTLPLHAMPVVLRIGKSNPAGMAAFAQHKIDTGTPKSAIPGVVKAAAKVAETVFESSSVGDVLGDIGAVLGALLL